MRFCNDPATADIAEAFAEEEAAFGSTNLQGLEARVLEAASRGAGSGLSSSAAPAVTHATTQVAAKLLVVAAVVGGGTVGSIALLSDAPRDPAAQVSLQEQPLPAVQEEQPSPEPIAVGEPDPSVPAEPVHTAAPRSRLSRPGENVDQERPASNGPESPVPEAVVPETLLGSDSITSQLLQELADYDRGVTALREGDPERAALLFDRYLETYPDGRLVSEARLSRVEAWVRSRRYGAAAQEAQLLADLPDLANRRGELLQVAAESLLPLGECDRARQLFDQALDAGAEFDPDSVAAKLLACRASQGSSHVVR